MAKYKVKLQWFVVNEIEVEAPNEEAALDEAWNETEATDPNEFEWFINEEKATKI